VAVIEIGGGGATAAGCVLAVVLELVWVLDEPPLTLGEI
jgi:hypothetical protein